MRGNLRESLGRTSVHANDDIPGSHLANYDCQPGFLGVLAELLAALDLESPRAGERLHGLNAAQIGARQHSIDGKAPQQTDKSSGLSATSVVQRAETVVALPVAALARPGVPDEEDQGDSTTARSPSQVRSSSAAASVTQRASSTSRLGANSPDRTDMSQ